MSNPIRRLDAALAGWPDTGLTVLLFAIAFVLIAVALFAPRLVKAGVAAWALFP